MATTTMLHVRIDENIKAQATETLGAMGLTVSDAVRVFLTRVVADKQMPFVLRAPNTETLAAMEETEQIIAARNLRFKNAVALFDDLENKSHK
jgi:DNA-damage-inducible protein J